MLLVRVWNCHARIRASLTRVECVASALAPLFSQFHLSFLLSSCVFSSLVFSAVLNGLKALHSKGVVHGRLSPSTVLLCQPGRQVKLCDYGIPLLVHASNSLHLTPFDHNVLVRMCLLPLLPPLSFPSSPFLFLLTQFSLPLNDIFFPVSRMM